MKRRDPQERSRRELDEALTRYGSERDREAARGPEPWPGDLFVLAETAEFPVEWLLVERGRQGRCLIVAADANPILGCADVAVPPEASGGPLSVRCDVGLQIGIESLRRGERTGSLAANDLDRVRRLRAEVAAGGVPDPKLGAGGEPDPSYEDWLAEIVLPARAALLPVAKEEPGLAFRRARKGIAAAAGLVLFLAVCGVSILAWRFHQGERQARQEVSRLLEESRRREAAYRRELESERQRLEAAYQKELAARRIPTPGSEAGRPLANLVYASFYPGASRGTVRELAAPPGTTYLFLLFYVGHRPLSVEYRVDVEKGAGGAIWSLGGLHLLPSQEVSVALPRAQVPDGAYRMRLYGVSGKERQDLGQFEVRIVSQLSHLPDR